jgi:hypothetical protein
MIRVARTSSRASLRSVQPPKRDATEMSER